jgi:hypothetical protein
MLDMQRVLSKVLTSDDFRQIFLTDPNQACRDYNLTPKELESLKALNVERMSSYAIILRDGRIGLALKAFPVTQTLLPEDFHKFTVRYTREYPPITLPGSGMYNEAMMLFHFIVRLIEEGELAHPHLRDALEYEKNLFAIGSRLDASLSAQAFASANAALPEEFTEARLGHLKPIKGEHAEVSSFNYNIIELIPYLSRRESHEFNEERTYILFHKVPEQPGVKISKVNKATHDLIKLCTSEHTVSGIISELASLSGITSVDGKAELASRGLKMFKLLIKANVIKFIE